MKDVIGPGFDVILFDEAHLGSTSDLSKQAVQKLMVGPHTLLVLITATYILPIGGDPGYSVPRGHLLTWSLLDVGYARSGNLKALAAVHGEKHVQAALRLSGIAASEQVRPVCTTLQAQMTFWTPPVSADLSIFEAWACKPSPCKH